jgi:hypothetical protein
MRKEACEVHDRLTAEAHAQLKKLSQLVGKQVQAFEVSDHDKFMRYDKELENALGEKERRIGALRQHDEEHGCQNNSWPDD